MSEDRKAPEGNQDFHFIEEAVIPRRKNKIKKGVISFVSTVALAIVFGLVARYIFIASEPWMKDLLGIEEEDPANFSFASSSPTASPSPTPSPTEPPVTPSPSPTPTPQESDDELTGDIKDPAATPAVIEQRIDATAEDYVKMMLEIKQIALSSYPSLVTVTAVESGVDWFNETYEKKNITTGAIIEINKNNVLIMTSYEELKGASFIKVAFNDGSTIDASILNYDSDYDVAILSVPFKSLQEDTANVIKTALLGESYGLNIGTLVIAVGNPNGYPNSMDIGLITRKAGIKSIVDNRVEIYQSSIINYKESGGFILNSKGEIVGCITQVLLADADDSMSTIVGISKLKPVIERLINKQDCVYLGIIADDIPQSELDNYSIPNGIYVSDLRTDSPAFKYGIKRGDIITGIDDYTIMSINSFVNVLERYQPGTAITVKLKRISKQVYRDMEITVTLGTKGDT